MKGASKAQFGWPDQPLPTLIAPAFIEGLNLNESKNRQRKQKGASKAQLQSHFPFITVGSDLADVRFALKFECFPGSTHHNGSGMKSTQLQRDSA